MNKEITIIDYLADINKRLIDLEKEVQDLKQSQCAGCHYRLNEIKEREQQFDLENSR